MLARIPAIGLATFLISLGFISTRAEEKNIIPFAVSAQLSEKDDRKVFVEVRNNLSEPVLVMLRPTEEGEFALTTSVDGRFTEKENGSTKSGALKSLQISAAVFPRYPAEYIFLNGGPLQDIPDDRKYIFHVKLNAKPEVEIGSKIEQLILTVSGHIQFLRMSEISGLKDLRSFKKRLDANVFDFSTEVTRAAQPDQ